MRDLASKRGELVKLPAELESSLQI
jgi:hypothetical protein